MIFNWFKRGGENNLEKKLGSVNLHLKNSFILVKKDISEMGSWVKELHEKHECHSSKLEKYEKRLACIEGQLHELHYLLSNKKMPEAEAKAPVIAQEEFDFSQLANSFSALRNTEKEVFKKLKKLFQERGKSIHLKDLAAEVYPEKDYEKVRTALANHITALEMFGFVYRQRVGREVYIGFTEQGGRFISQISEELKKASKKATVKSKVKY